MGEIVGVRITDKAVRDVRGRNGHRLPPQAHGDPQRLGDTVAL